MILPPWTRVLWSPEEACMLQAYKCFGAVQWHLLPFGSGTPKSYHFEPVGFQNALLLENDSTHGMSWGQATQLIHGLQIQTDGFLEESMFSLLASWQGQQKAWETRLKSVASTLLSVIEPTNVLMLCGLLLKSWDILSLQEFCGSLLDFSWGLLRVCLARRNELGPESGQALGSCDTSILNFCLRGSQFSLIGEMCQAIITILGWCNFESLGKSLLDHLQLCQHCPAEQQALGICLSSNTLQ